MAGEVKEHGASTDLIFRWRLVRNARARIRRNGCNASLGAWIASRPRPMLNGRHGAPGRKLMPRVQLVHVAARLLPSSVPDSAAHRVMNPLCAVPRFLRLFPLPLPPDRSFFLSVAGHERHLMKCHRCPTDRRAKCRRLPIPRLSEPSDFDFTRNAVKMTPQIPTCTLLSLPNPRSWNLISCRQCVCDSW